MSIHAPRRPALWIGLLLSAGVHTATADRRAYVWTYEYMTVPQGAAELETYLTHKIPDTGQVSRKNTWEPELELEYGLTNHWDISLYQRWKQTNTATDDTFEYTGHKLRTRYRVAEKGDLPVDVLLYLEYKRPDGSTPDDAWEGKIILAKDLGRFNLAYNHIVEQGLRHPQTPVHEYAFGAGYEFHPRFKAGVESQGNYSKSTYYLGPTISVARRQVWVSIGFLAGLNNEADDIRARLIAGIPLR